MSVEDLCRREVAEHLDRTDAWDRYEIISAHEDDYGDHDWYRINCWYQGKEHSLPSVLIEQVGRSGSLEYNISAYMFEEDNGRYAADINNMIASFSF